MKTWKQYPHLFNGFFVKNYAYRPQKIVGSLDDMLLVVEEFEEEILYRDTNKCTLIARKIEDMTDEEKKFFDGLIYKHHEGNWIKPYSANADTVWKAGLYLLSIGVYPFDQSHFETGEVIDINEPVT